MEFEAMLKQAEKEAVKSREQEIARERRVFITSPIELADIEVSDQELEMLI